MKADIQIRKMTLEDLDELMEIEEKSFSIPWSREAFKEELLYNNCAIYHIAEFDDKIVGYIGTWTVVDEMHITSIAVEPDYRNLGIGTALLEAVIKIANRMNIKNIYLEVRESNLTAQRLYKKFAFEVVGKRKQYYLDNQEDALLMTKELK